MPERDFFRDTWVRYLGYANEVGESLRLLVPRRVVRASYGVAFAYVFADTADKTIKSFKQQGTLKSIVISTGDALLWQNFASIIIPGYTINRICANTNEIIKKRYKFPKKTRHFLTLGVGLMSIPIIVRPIDYIVTVAMDMTYRKMF